MRTNQAPKIYVAGHRGMVGSAIVRLLLAQENPPERTITRSHAELDLRHQAASNLFIESEKPDQVYIAAAEVGGIPANNPYHAHFLNTNLMVQGSINRAAFITGVKKLLFLGSSCIYPRLAPQPMAEAPLLTGPLERTNEPYAIAKIAGPEGKGHLGQSLAPSAQAFADRQPQVAPPLHNLLPRSARWQLPLRQTKGRP